MFNKSIPLDIIKKKYSYNNSKFVIVNGIQLHYRKTGEGPVLLLLHGLSSSLHTWDEWHNSKQLANYKLISVDMPAHGLSDAFNNDDYSIEALTSTLFSFLDTLHVSHCSIIGNSLGGKLAWSMSIFHTERITKLILINATGYFRKSLPLSYKIAKSPFYSILKYIIPRIYIVKQIANHYNAQHIINEETTNRYIDLFRKTNFRNIYKKFILEHFSQNEFKNSAKIKTITTPTLILWGEEDRIIPANHAFKFNKDIKNSQLIMYPSLGHLPMEEAPQLTIKDVIEFLKN